MNKSKHSSNERNIFINKKDKNTNFHIFITQKAIHTLRQGSNQNTSAIFLNKSLKIPEPNVHTIIFAIYFHNPWEKLATKFLRRLFEIRVLSFFFQSLTNFAISSHP